MDVPETTELAFLVARIPHYPAYGDEVERRQTDTFVRSYVGEALALVRDRFAERVQPALGESLEALLLHCQFTDQVFVKHLEHATLDDARLAALLGADRELVECADAMPNLAFEDLPSLMARVEATFARRKAAVV
jgi:hypothetical protein